MIDFPNSPVVGQVIATPEGTQWSWDGAVWRMIASATGIVSYLDVGVKVGVISAFSGDTVPVDSLVCNGQAVPAGAEYDALRAIVGANVPDLRDKFLLGASATRALRSTGGAATHTLTTAEMPSHSHSVVSGGTLGFDFDQIMTDYAGGGTKTAAIPSSVGTVSDASGAFYAQAVGGGAAHNNIPPYYAVVFIIQAKASKAAIAGREVVFGAGLAQSPTGTIDVVAGDASIVVGADEIHLNQAQSLQTLYMGGNVSMGTGAKIDFTDELGTKVDLYGNEYKIGIDNGAVTYESGGVHSFRTLGTQHAYIDAGAGVVSKGSFVQSGTDVGGPSYENVYEIYYNMAFSAPPIVMVMNGDNNVGPFFCNILARFAERVTVRVYGHDGGWISHTIRLDWIAHGPR